jgi:hypothetical protein
MPSEYNKSPGYGSNGRAGFFPVLLIVVIISFVWLLLLFH